MRQSVQQKRLMQEVKHLAEHATDEYKAGPLSNDMHTWHFTLRGPPGTEYEDGIYHGRITFPFDYPLSPPDIYFLNKSGRFEINSKICLTITGYHAEQWNASWTVRSMLEGIISMFPEKEKVMSVGSLNQSIEQRKKHATESWNYVCEQCGKIGDKMKRREKVAVVEGKEGQGKKNEEIDDKKQSNSEKDEEQLAQQRQAVDIAEILEEEKKVLEAISIQIAKGKRDRNTMNSTVSNVQIQKNLQPQDKTEQIYEMHSENRQVSSGNTKKQDDKTFDHSAGNEGHQFSFEWIMNGLQETVNVIYSIRPIERQEPEIPPQNIKKEQQKEPVIVEEPSKPKEEAKQADGEEDSSDGSSNSEEGVEENKNQEANEGEAAQNDVDNSEEHKNKSANEILKELQASVTEEEKIIEKAEALKKIKKLDFLIFITFIFLVLYITFTLQSNFK